MITYLGSQTLTYRVADSDLEGCSVSRMGSHPVVKLVVPSGYTTQARRDAATVVFYGAPVTDVAALRGLAAPVCGCYGKDDAQFPQFVVDGFRDALAEVGALGSGLPQPQPQPQP